MPVNPLKKLSHSLKQDIDLTFDPIIISFLKLKTPNIFMV